MLALLSVEGARGAIMPDPEPPTSPRLIAAVYFVNDHRHESRSVDLRIVRKLCQRGLVWMDPVTEPGEVKSWKFGVTSVGRDWLKVYKEHEFGSSKVLELEDRRKDRHRIEDFTTPGGKRGWMFHCPGCECGHYFEEGRWMFNGDYVRPTFAPSLVMRSGDSVCHSYVRNGRIEFLGDCTHALAGQTVDLPAV